MKFGLRTILIVVVLACLAFALLRPYEYESRERRRLGEQELGRVLVRDSENGPRARKLLEFEKLEVSADGHVDWWRGHISERALVYREFLGDQVIHVWDPPNRHPRGPLRIVVLQFH